MDSFWCSFRLFLFLDVIINITDAIVLALSRYPHSREKRSKNCTYVLVQDICGSLSMHVTWQAEIVHFISAQKVSFFSLFLFCVDAPHKRYRCHWRRKLYKFSIGGLFGDFFDNSWKCDPLVSAFLPHIILIFCLVTVVFVFLFKWQQEERKSYDFLL